MTGRLQLLLNEAKALRSAASVGPHDASDFMSYLVTETERQHIEELESSIRHDNEVLTNEILEVRLIGTQVDDGTVPLSLLARIARHLNSAFLNAANYGMTGLDSKKLPDQIESMLNLRLSGLTSGSSRIFVRGDARPDLTGESVFQSSIRSAFSLLLLEGGSVHESVNQLGLKSVRSFTDFLEDLARERLAAELTWFAPSARRYRWTATTSDVTYLSGLLRAVDEPKTMVSQLSGKITMLSESGRMQIRDENGDKLQIFYPRDVFDKVQSLHLGENVSLSVQKKSFFDKVSEKDIIKYKLLDVMH